MAETPVPEEAEGRSKEESKVGGHRTEEDLVPSCSPSGG